MKTDQLIQMLAQGAGPAPRNATARGLGIAAAMGLLASATLSLGLLGGIPREMLATPAPWIKLAYAAAFAVTAGWLTARLSRPLTRLAVPASCVGIVVGVMVLAGGFACLTTPEPGRATALFGQSWLTCPWKIFCMSMPALAASLWTLKGLAPAHPWAAGLAAGLFAGSVGAAGYATVCLEVSVTFVAVWYSLGIAAVGAVGALLGGRILHW